MTIIHVELIEQQIHDIAYKIDEALPQYMVYSIYLLIGIVGYKKTLVINWAKQ